MIRFFRQIRQRLLTENRFSKYLLYAVGEILLVVIGILIALQFNNWNEKRIAVEETKTLFKEVNNELVQNIKNGDRLIRIFNRKDPTYFKVIHKKVGYTDYEDSPELFGNLFSWNTIGFVDDDFNELLERKDNLTEPLESIFSDLKDLYAFSKTNLDEDDDLILDLHLNFENKMNNVLTSWYEFNSNGIITDEIINFALNDPYYLNSLSQQLKWQRNQIAEFAWFRANALTLHDKITTILNIEKDTSLLKDIKNFDYIKGDYGFGTFKTEIYGEEQLRMNIFRNDTLVSRWDIHPYSNSHLIFSRDFKGSAFITRIDFDENQEVIGLIMLGNMTEQDGNRVMFKKLRQ